VPLRHITITSLIGQDTLALSLHQSLRPTGFAIFTAAVAAVLAFSYVLFRLNTEPVLFLIASGGTLLGLWVMRKWPVLLLTALLYVGNFKQVAAQGTQITDPTMILLLLTAGAVMIDLLYILSGSEDCTLAELFAGQAPTIFLFVLFTLVFVSSIIYSREVNYGTLKITRFAVFEVLAFVAPLLLLKNSSHVRQFVIASTVGSIALVIRDVLQLIYASPLLVQGDADITRIGDAMLIGITILIALYYGVARSRSINNLVLAVLAAGMIVCAARSPLLALVITILISAGMVRGGMVSRKKILIGAAIFVVVGAIAFQWLEALPWARGKVSWKENELVSVAHGSLVTGGTISDRLSYNASALEALKEHPLFGLGAGGWARFYSQDEVPRFPHDFVLEVAAEQGLIGFVLLLALLAMLFRASYRIRDRKDLGFLFPVLTFCVIYNMLTGDIENRQLWFWLGMVAAGSRMALLPDPETAESETVPVQLACR
jgi:O-antigen ligase